MGWLANLIGIGRASLVDDSGELQLVQVTEGAAGAGFFDRITDGVRRVAEFGFASVPPIGAEVLLLRRGGDRSRSIVIGTSHRPSRLRNLKPGDVGIHDVRGAKVTLTAEGLLIDCAGLPALVQNATTITLKATQKVTIDAPAAEFTGTVHASGEISSDADLKAAGHSMTVLRAAYNGHKHGGVAAGAAVSAVTDTAAG